jgi:hypothetical protein
MNNVDSLIISIYDIANNIDSYKYHSKYCVISANKMKYKIHASLDEIVDYSKSILLIDEYNSEDTILNKKIISSFIVAKSNKIEELD